MLLFDSIHRYIDAIWDMRMNPVKLGKMIKLNIPATQISGIFLHNGVGSGVYSFYISLSP